MSNRKILTNIFSNWTNFVLLIGIAFVVSPIIVHKLGNERYGIWTLIVSITGYFTVLDFGINTAIVRFVSKYKATNEIEKLRGIYSSSFLFFFIAGIIAMLIIAIFAHFFKDIFGIESISRKYISAVLLIVGIDFSLSLIFSVFLGSLRALQEFLAVNIISISTSILKNIFIVIALYKGGSLLSLAIIQISSNIIKYISQHILIRKKYAFLSFNLSLCSKQTFKQIFDYSIYSFLIAVAIKVLFYTDSIVIGSLLTISDVTFYAIPATIIDYLEKLIWAVISVLIPIISSFEAVGDNKRNSLIYSVGTKYTLFLALPILIVLFTAGSDFIRLWMGPDYEVRSGNVLKILLIGYFFALSQLIAHGILKGVSLHKALAYILCIEALANLLLSVILAKTFGINGVAFGTTLPLIAANLFFIPFYTCKKLDIPYLHYLQKSYTAGFLILVFSVIAYSKVGILIQSYLALAIYSLFVATTIAIVTFLFILEEEHRIFIINKIKPLLGQT